MSVPLINRSLTTIRTELEFLKDSEVITEELYQKLNQSLPAKFTKDMNAWGVEKLGLGNNNNNNSTTTATDRIAEDLAMTTISTPSQIEAPPHPPRSNSTAKNIGYCKVLYDYRALEADDLDLKKEDRIAIVQHLSPDWWKGYKQDSSPEKAGVFPSNYVVEITEKEFQDSFNRAPTTVPEKASYKPQNNLYQQHQMPPPDYGSPYGQPPVQHQPSYGGYAQYPPPSTNYYQPPPPQQQPQQVQQVEVQPQSSGVNAHPHLKKFGSKLGNAAIFGAGATIGSNVVNSIF